MLLVSRPSQVLKLERQSDGSPFRAIINDYLKEVREHNAAVLLVRASEFQQAM